MIDVQVFQNVGLLFFVTLHLYNLFPFIMPPKKKKAAVVVDPAIAEMEAKRKNMIREAAALQKMLQFEQQEAGKLQLSNFQIRRNWVCYLLLFIQAYLLICHLFKAIDKNRIEELKIELRVKEGEIETVRDQHVCHFILFSFSFSSQADYV